MYRADMNQGEPHRIVVVVIETTGLAPTLGDRVIEVGAVELVDLHVTSNFHSYLNCGQDSDTESLARHGLTTEFLSDQPAFPEIAKAFSEYLHGAVLVALANEWTKEFIDQEFARVRMPPTDEIIAGIEDP